MEIACPYCGKPVPRLADILAKDTKCPSCGRNIAFEELPTMAPAQAPGLTPLTLPEGLHLGGCRLLRVIGRGGMGEVYEAIQESLNRRVAVKVLPPHLARAPAFVKRFERE